jgi:hypothetical protein
VARSSSACAACRALAPPPACSPPLETLQPASNAAAKTKNTGNPMFFFIFKQISFETVSKDTQKVYFSFTYKRNRFVCQDKMNLL